MAGTPAKLAAGRAPLALNDYDLRYLRKAIRYRVWLAFPDARHSDDLAIGIGD